MKSTLLIVLSLCIVAVGLQAQTELTAEYGPPAEANVWEKYTIPVTAETFGVEPSELEAALTNITSFWIRTEMHTGNDVGGIDDVMIGSEFMSDFNFSYEGWSSGGDGTMEWVSEGGVEGGFLQISDWASGDWHWLIAPASWAGDWSALNGQNIEFWYKTNQPSYSAIIKLTTEPINRLVINTPTGNFIPPNDSVLVQIEVTPVADEDMIITFTSSDNNCILAPEPVTIAAGNSSQEFYLKTATNPTEGCTAVIEAKYPGYISSRVTLKAEDHTSVKEPAGLSTVAVYPNPTNGVVTVEGNSLNIHRIMVFDLIGNTVEDIRDIPSGKIGLNLDDHYPGMYFIKIFTEGEIVTSKVILK